MIGSQVGLLDEADRNLVQMHSEMAKISMDNEQWHLASSVKIQNLQIVFFLAGGISFGHKKELT